MPINSSNNVVGSPPYTATISGLFSADSTDKVNVDDTGVELLASLSNLPDNIVAVFIQNIGDTNNVGVFVGESDTGFTDGTQIAPGNGITIEPLGSNIYLKCGTGLDTDIVCIVQYSTVSFPPA